MKNIKESEVQEMVQFIWGLKHQTLRKIIKQDLEFVEAMELIEDQLKGLSFNIDKLRK
tara:strand:- start:515 stop:688 length:174 start_codon:yes stop_codon:yes gene_type:complete